MKTSQTITLKHNMYVADLTFSVPGLDNDVPGLAYEVQDLTSEVPGLRPSPI